MNNQIFAALAAMSMIAVGGCGQPASPPAGNDAAASAPPAAKVAPPTIWLPASGLNRFLFSRRIVAQNGRTLRCADARLLPSRFVSISKGALAMCSSRAHPPKYSLTTIIPPQIATEDEVKTPRLHLPRNTPVKDNGSVTVYETQTRGMLPSELELVS